MQKRLGLLAVAVVAFAFVAEAGASGHCPSRPNGECPTVKKQKPDSRKNYTEKQRKEMWDTYNKKCMKVYPGTRLVQLDYYHRRYVCGQ